MAISLRSVGASPGANSTTCVITKPAGLAVGDFMLAHVVFKASSGTIALSGWTVVGAQSNTASSRSAVLWKIAVAADVAASTFTFTSATGRNRGEMSAWLGVDSTNPINVADQQINAAGTSIAVPTPTVTNTCLVLIVGSNAAGGTASACSGSDPAATITLGYAVAYSTYCALAMFSGVKSGTDAIDAHSLSTFTSAVSSGHAIALNPTAIDFVTAEGNETQLSDGPGLTQTHNLTIAEGAQVQTSDTPSLTGTHILVSDEGIQTQVSDIAALAVTHVLAADEGAQVQVSDTPTIEQEAGAIDLIPAEGIQLEISDTPALIQEHNLIIAEGAQTQLSDAQALTQTHILAAAENIQAQDSDPSVVTQTHVLTIDEGTQIQVSDAPVLSQEHHLAASGGAQTQASGMPTLGQEHQLAAAKAYQIQISDTQALSQEHGLVAQKGTQVQISDGAILELVGGAIDLVAVEGIQEQISDSANITKIIDLITAEGMQGQISDDAILDLNIWLIIQEGWQAQISDSPTLNQPVDPKFWASKKKPYRFIRTSSKRPGCKQKAY